MADKRTRGDKKRRSSLFLTVRLGFEGVFAGESSKEEILARLRDYPLNQVLDVVGRISALFLFRATDDPVLNDAAAAGLLGYKADRFLSAAAEMRKADRSAESVAVFDSTQLIVTAKLALAQLTPVEAEGQESLIRLGESLLMIGDVIGRQHHVPESVDISDPEVLSAWAHFLVVNGLAHGHQDRVHLLARSYELFLTAHGDLADDKAYMDLPELVQGATGLSANEYWITAFSLLSHWSSINVGNFFERQSHISTQTYFSRNFTFSAAETAKFFALFGKEAEQLQLELSQLSEEDLWSAYYPLPLAASPLVLLGDRAYCPSARLLLERMTDGLYHVLLNAVEISKRNKLQSYLGRVFEDYVERTLQRMYSSSGPNKPRFISEADLKSTMGGPGSRGVCDGVLLHKRVAVLVESKAARLSLEKKAGKDETGTLAKLNEIFIEGVQQIFRTIEAIQDGRLRSLGVDESQIDAFFPLVVTLEDIPLRKPLYLALDRLIETPPPRTRRWQAFHISELESSEGAVANGRDLIEFLRRKDDDAEYRFETATNYAFAVGDRFLSYRSPYLTGVFSELGEKAHAFLRTRSAEGYRHDD